jgi:3-isopropylmalate dehydrogenase
VRVRPGQASPLTLPPGREIDFVLIRESTEGLFHSQGAGVVTETEARETLLITRDTSEKLFRFAFDLAEERRRGGAGPGRVTCVDKANVFRAFAFFRSIFDEEAARRPDLGADRAYVDATALRMLQAPWDFDVLVTENMFGDILSDLGAALMGGSASRPRPISGWSTRCSSPATARRPTSPGGGSPTRWR